MGKIFAMTLDLESDTSGVLNNEYVIFKKPDSIESLLSFLQEEGVKLSVFVVGEVIKKFPDIVSLFMNYNCEFHCHSFSHNPQFPDTEDEIMKSKMIYTGFFNKEPVGYRAPQGRITDEGISFLEKHGFKFDSSIFPSYYPNPFKYLFKNRTTYKYNKFDIVEIPITSLSPVRVTFSISFIKLLGGNIYWNILKTFKLPDSVVFGSHLHDFFLADESMQKLPGFWKFVYSRNRYEEYDMLRYVFDHFRKRAYKFGYISEIYSDFIDNNNDV